jgi:tRNA(Arg) A34 adenosine deaminase TadA
VASRPAVAAGSLARWQCRSDTLAANLMNYPTVTIGLPPWASAIAEPGTMFADDSARMTLAISLARANVEHKTGGPFGAAIFERDSGRLVSVGVNAVVRLTNCTLHAEMVAFQIATQRIGHYSLGGEVPAHELVTSCDPCAMCLGAILWSGVSRVVCGALREDATALGFDEGPVFPASWQYLADRGVAVVRGVRRDEARAVLELYRGHGPLYNG